RRPEEIKGGEKQKIEKHSHAQGAESEGGPVPGGGNGRVKDQPSHEEGAQPREGDGQRQEEHQNQGEQDPQQAPAPEGAHLRGPVNPVQDLLEHVEGRRGDPQEQEGAHDPQPDSSVEDALESALNIHGAEGKQADELGGESRVLSPQAEEESENRGEEQQQGKEGKESVVGEARNQDLHMILPVFVPQIDEKLLEGAQHGKRCYQR